jgi:peptidoglycan/LPS O-acetylase OafA/YrhL
MSSQERLHALDAVRAFALLAGIVLHATMSFFLPIPAHDVSQSATLGVLFFVIHTFRMTTFFVVAGLFARLLLERRGARGFIADRAKRILGPMLVGWVVLAPLTIGALIWGVGRSADPAVRDAMTAAAANAGPGAFPLVHLWFLYYLAIFYVLVLAVRGLVMKVDRAGRLGSALDKVVRVLLRSYVAPIVLAAPIFAVLGFDQRILLLGGIPTPDSSLIPQLPALVGFGTAFGLGWLVHRQLDVLGEWRKRWLGHLVVGIALSVVCLTVPGIKNGTTAAWLFDSAEWSRTAYAACYLVSIWYWGFGIIGAALQFCASESPVRRYLADSSYWLYLAHLPIVFFLQAALALVPWHWTIKFPLILAIALTVLLASYHYLVRPTWIGQILNGRKYPRSKRTPGAFAELSKGAA